LIEGQTVKALIQKLVEAWGPSGYEHHVRALIQDEIQPYVDDIRMDGVGNLIARVGSGGAKIMVAAHMDEIGVMALFEEPNSGYLRFTALGGLLHTTMVGGRVRFEDGTIGVIGVHDYFGAGRTTVSELDDFFIDVSDGETDNRGRIAPGSPAGFSRPMETRGTRLIAKSMDDRIGCAVAVETIRRLNRATVNEVYFTFTVQEEVGLRGARPAAYGIDPDVAISLDVTSTGDLIKSVRNDIALGKGAAIKIHDAQHIVPMAIRDWMIARAEADGIPYQRELLTLGSTDAAAIQITRAGVPSGCISIPCRFVHTTSETVDERDVEACVRLLQGLVANAVVI
jgi:endoglucanase